MTVMRLVWPASRITGKTEGKTSAVTHIHSSESARDKVYKQERNLNMNSHYPGFLLSATVEERT